MLIDSLMSGTVTLARFCGMRTVPGTSEATAHVHVNASTDATRLHGSPPISTRKFEHSHCLCRTFGPALSRTSAPPPDAHRTCSASNSKSKYAASLLEPSSLGTVRLVSNASWNVQTQAAL